jgi:hypothetical protein
MQNDEIDDMLSGAIPTPHPGRWHGPDAESPRSLTETSVNPGHAGHLEGDRRETVIPENDRMKCDDLRFARDKFSDDVAMEIVSKTSGTKEAGDDFVTAATRAVEHAMRTVAAEFRGPAESARAIIAGVLRGSGENEDAALKTLSLAARVVVRKALLSGYGPTPWVQGVVSGALDGAQNLGLNRENAVSAATQGILKGADDARFDSSVAIDRVLEGRIQAVLASVADAAPDRRHDDHSNEGR